MWNKYWTETQFQMKNVIISSFVVAKLVSTPLITCCVSHCRNPSSLLLHLEGWICIPTLKDFTINRWEYKQLSLKDNDQSAKTETCDLVKYDLGLYFYLWWAIKHPKWLVWPKLMSVSLYFKMQCCIFRCTLPILPPLLVYRATLQCRNRTMKDADDGGEYCRHKFI